MGFASEYLKLRQQEIDEEKEKEEKEEKRTWFTGGAFANGALSDGYQFGDITKTLLGDIPKAAIGTVNDIGENVTQAVADATENLVDTAAYGIGQVGGWFSKDFQNGVKDFIAHDYSKEAGEAINQSPLTPQSWISKIIGGTDENSLLGDKSEGIVQSGAHLAGQAALQMVGVPWWLTSSVNSFGGEIESAFNEDATYGEAGLSGAISAGAEILTEKLGGAFKFQGKALTDGLTDLIGKKVSNKLVKTLLKFGVDAGSEGLEEIASEAASSFGKWITYQDEKTFNEMFLSEEAMDSYLDAFIGGAFLGGVGSVGGSVKNIKKGADPVTGLTKNEQKVVDQVFEKQVTERENKGEKLSKKDKNLLYDEIVEDMSNGNIDISDIEEALGGDSYKAYKSETDNAKKLKAEYDELANMEKGKMTHLQEKRLAELDKMDFNDTSKADGLKKTMSDEVYNLVKGDRKGKGSILMESYREEARKGEAFKADYSQYKGTKYESAAKQTIDNAIKAKANDTRKVHNIVDMAAKLSSETGVVYEFGSNETIKEDFIKLQSEKIAKLEAIENPTEAQTKALTKMKDVLQKVKDGQIKVNGNVSSKGVMLNLDSYKALNRVVGHELTHTLEKTAHYEKLQKALFDYAKTKGVKVDEKLRELESLYAGVEGDAKGELTADLVGDYLFNDYDFVKSLSKDRNLFQRVWDEIKYLAKMAKPSSKEARELAKVERMFEKAYQEMKTEAKANKGTQHSLSSMANTFFDDPNMSASEFVQKDYKQTQGYKDYVEQCLNNYRQTRVDFDEAAARKAIEDSIDGIVRVAVAAKNAGYDIYDDPSKVNKRDSKNRLLFSSLEPNSDYFTSSDISTICDKRKNFAEIYDEIVRQEEAKGVPRGKRFFDNVDNYFALHKIMADKGLTQPCRQCYVESMRKNLAPMANAFLKLVKETNPENKANEQLYQQGGKNKGELKTGNASIRELVLSAFELHPEYGMTANDLTVETLTTEDGLAQLKIQAPLIYEAFNSFYGQSKPKMPKSATPFRFGELTALLTDEHGKIKQGLVNKINATGGFRLQSYSDFQIQNYTDVLQVIFEAGTLGLKGHAYTKVPAFLDATEGTNLKRNISIFMYNDGGEWKIDKNDSFPYALDEIYDIVNADESGNTSIIAVSQNAEMSAWIMANDNVGYGIPFHKSGMKMGTVRDTDVKTDDGRVVKGYSGIKDHTKQQSEVWASTTSDHKALTKVKAGVNIYEIWDFDNVYGLSKNELIEKNVKAYIDECSRRGYLPKFREYVMNNDKVLNDVLKYAKELGYAPSDATIDDISFTYKGYTIPYGYYKFLGDFGMFSPDGTVSAPQTLSLENYDFDKAVSFFSDAESLRRNEILQQFSNGEERQKYRESGLNAGELNEIVKQKRSEVADEVINRNNKSADTFHSLSQSDDIAPIGRNDVFGRDFRVQEDIAPIREDVKTTQEEAPTVSNVENVEDGVDIATTVRGKLNQRLENREAELEQAKLLKDWTKAQYDNKISKMQTRLDAKKDKTTKAAIRLQNSINRQKRLASDLDAEIQNRINNIEKSIGKVQGELDMANATPITTAKKDKLTVDLENIEKKYTEGRNTIVSEKAQALYDEVNAMQKNKRVSKELGDILNRLDITDENKANSYRMLRTALLNVNRNPNGMVNNNPDNENFAVESMVRERIDDAIATEAEKAREEARKENERIRRKDLHEKKVGDIKARFAEEGKDFDEALEKAKRMHTFSINDNTPQRVNDKTFGYEAGEILNDMTFNKVAENETEATKWANEQVATFRKLSKKYNIKPNSKQSAAAMMYGEGFYADDKGNLIKYGDEELAKDFPNAKERENIKGLANDKAVREFYDKTLDAINESRVRNGYPEIPKRQNYYLHFRAMEDTFSRLGIPFNPNDIKAKDLPTDINGMTADLKPGQPYFASANRRMGNRTTYDLLGGMERYMNGAKAQIYHIDDIQNIRALRNYIADKYGQANGLENLDSLTPEEQETRIQEVFSGHLSNYAKFLNEYANNLAGKTALMDRSVEGIFGRRGIQALKTLNSQVAKNMVGFNVGSAGTNLLSMVQAAAKLKKADFIKAFAQTISNKFNKDGFVEKNGALVRRRGADKFNKTAWEKATDTGFWLMGAVDNFSSEVIVRAKYNELVKGGMESETAHKKAGEWAMRVLGDRSLGQMPMQYNSAIMGIFNKFQLEVRNQLDSMVYDTVHENMASDGTNAKKATKIAKTMVELAVFQHIFGQVYESIAGYNPAFDIISTIATLFGWDDDEDDEDTFVQNLGQASEEFLGDLPYSNLITDGGRIPIMDSLPIKQLLSGKDDYGNEVSALETIGEALPYYVLPTGYGQIKKTTQGLSMFSEDIGPVTGSYTNSGNLRFPVEDTPWNRIQAGIFGQYSSKNAREYFDEGYAPLNPNQTQEYADVGMSFTDYNKYRDGLKGLKTLAEKFDYIDSLDLTVEQKNILINNIVDRDEPVDMTDYGNYGHYEEFDFAVKNPEKYSFFKDNNISYEAYAESEESREAYNWAYNNPEKYEVSKAVGDVMTYRTYSKDLNNIQADKDKNGNSISGSRKKKVVAYINNLDADYGAKIILYKTQYPADDRYNKDIVEYLNERDDISYMQMVVILTELGMKVDANGKVTWD